MDMKIVYTSGINV